MKKILTIMSLLIPLFFVSCSSSDNIPDSAPIKLVAGTWNSFRIFDENENDIDGAEMSLVLQQKGSLISGVLNIKEDNVTVQTVDLNGSVSDDTFTLIGKSGTDSYMLNGYLEDNTSMQITENKNYDTSDINNLKVTQILLTLENLEVSAFTTNKYEITCKCNCETRSDDNIILIHGLNSEASIWDTMVQDFKENSICDDFTVWTYQYDWKDHIEKSAQDMIARVNYELGDKEPILIAHSMGGLVARSYIAKYGYYKRLITLGTPHLGAKLGYALFATYDGIRDLTPTSEFMQGLNSNIFESRQHSNYLLLNGRIGYDFKCTQTCTTFWGEDFCCMYGYVGKGGDYPTLIDVGYAILSKPNDGMVEEPSARFAVVFDGGIQRAPADKFEWICHDWLPFKSPVIKYIEQILMDSK